MTVEFTASAYRDYLYWKTHNQRILERIHTLCKAIAEKPFDGIGKPEPLLYDLQGCWSRRIDHIHRLVYRIERKRIVVIACRYHY
ncbi:MAG: Txe/YoeB family addiction module toxin [Candidatus Peregrinibacteria bacterium]